MKTDLTRPYVLQPCLNGIILFPLEALSNGNSLDFNKLHVYNDYQSLLAALQNLVLSGDKVENNEKLPLTSPI